MYRARRRVVHPSFAPPSCCDADVAKHADSTREFRNSPDACTRGCSRLLLAKTHTTERERYGKTWVMDRFGLFQGS